MSGAEVAQGKVDFRLVMLFDFTKLMFNLAKTWP